MSVEDLKTALIKRAANGAVENNEGDTNKGVADVYPTPPGRSPGTLDARWGDKPAEGHDGYTDVYSTSVRREAEDGRGALLDRLFDSPKSTAPAEQALMHQHFENAGAGDPHSPMLQHGHSPLRGKTAHAVYFDDETLTDQVLRVAGRR